MAPYYGFEDIVCFFTLSAFVTTNSFPDFAAGAGKSILWYAVFHLLL
jgi:hypothetical protein